MGAQLTAFVMTQCCEVPLVVFLARPKPWLRTTWVAVAAQCLTHPVVWHYSLVLAPDEYLPGLTVLELGAVLVEGFWYQFWLRPGLRKALLWSLAANVASLCIGYLFLG